MNVARVLPWYYAATALFLILDYVFDINVRVAFLESLPAARIVSRMRRRTIPAVLSNDAGAYLCNAVLYHSLELMRVMGIDGQCGFIHLPTNLARGGRARGPANAPRLSFEQALAGGCEALATLLRRSAT